MKNIFQENSLLIYIQSFPPKVISNIYCGYQSSARTQMKSNKVQIDDLIKHIQLITSKNSITSESRVQTSMCYIYKAIEMVNPDLGVKDNTEIFQT